MFKDIIANDINTFLNLSEFADEVTIDGKKITAVVDNESRTYEQNKDEMERSIGNILLFVNKETWKKTYKKLPKAFDAMKFNKIACTVVRVTDRNGVLSITLDYGG